MKCYNKSITVLLIVFIFNTPVNAQMKAHFGATIGGSFNSFLVDNNLPNNSDTLLFPKSNNQAGVRLGLFFYFNLSKKISLKPTANICLNEVGKIVYNKVVANESFNNSSVAVSFSCPIAYNFFNKKITPYISITPVLYYNLTTNDNAQAKLDLKNMDLLGQVSFGVRVPFKSFSISPELSFSSSFINQVQNNQNVFNKYIESIKRQSIALSFFVGRK